MELNTRVKEIMEMTVEQVDSHFVEQNGQLNDKL